VHRRAKQPGLADAGVTGEEDPGDGGTLVGRFTEPGLEVLQLGVTTDEGLAGLGRHDVHHGG
jgi:hypothetical protein